jgi:4'-phosphopantetheinyl transferase
MAHRTMPAPPRLRLADCDAWDPAAFAGSLSDAERTRAGRYRRAVDRERFVVRRGLLRRLLGECLGLPPAAVPLDTAPQGKPMLPVADAAAAAPRHVAFNLSHSGGTALFGLAPAAGEGMDAAIGVDLEAVEARRRTLDELLHVARRIAPEEAEALAAMPGMDAAAAFHRLWTCKEACLKCLGTGIGGGGPEIATVVRTAAADGDGVETWRAGGHAWSVRCFEPCPGHVAAIARPTGAGAVPGIAELDWLRPSGGERRPAER